MPSPAMVARCATRLATRIPRSALRPVALQHSRSYIRPTQARLNATVNAENKKIETSNVLAQAGVRPEDVHVAPGISGDALMSPQAGASYSSPAATNITLLT